MSNINYTYTNLTPFKWYVLENFPFIEADFDALTDWQLFCKLGKEINKIIISLNGVGKQVEDLTTFVTNYFDNLDVQDEINNKLDEMVQDGTLQEIITQYLQINGLLIFDNIDDMKSSTMLINNSTCRTLGYYNKNDGGGATYYITDTLNPNETNTDINIITLNNGKYAHLIYDSVLNVKQFGMYCDNINDDSTILEKIINFAKSGDIIEFPNAEIKIGKEIEINKDITLKGTSNLVNGTKFNFNNTSGFSLKSNYIIMENISIVGSNNPNYSTLNINNNIFGNIGLRFEYNDNFTNSGCKIKNCFVNNFNIGIAIYTTITTQNKWSGAYRVFEDCYISYNDIGVLVKDGATFNKIIGGNISANTHNGIYSNSGDLYNNLELIGTALEGNGSMDNFTNEIFTDFGIYNIGNSKINFTNCYLETMKCFVEEDSSLNLINTYIHNNVFLNGNGQINSESSLSSYKTIITNSIDLKTRMTASNMELTQPYTDVSYVNVKSSYNGINQLAYPNVINLPIPIKNIDFIQIDFDVKLNQANDNFAIKPIIQIVGAGSSGNDNTTPNINYPIKNYKYPVNKWTHQTFIYKPRLGASYLTNGEQIAYRITPLLVFSNDENSNNSDYSTNNLDVDISNMNITIHAKSNESTNPELSYVKSLIT